MESKSILNGEISYYPTFYAKNEAKDLYNDLAKNIIWQQQELSFFGKTVLEPRLTALYGLPHLHYTYSGSRLVALDWSATLNTIKSKIEVTTKQKFNSVLLNFYRSGEDYMGWHSDDEKELGPSPTIASLSLGAERTFYLRRKEDKKHKLKYDLKDGSLIVMSGEMQHYWQHQIPKRKRITSGRINLTFRNIYV